ILRRSAVFGNSPLSALSPLSVALISERWGVTEKYKDYRFRPAILAIGNLIQFGICVTESAPRRSKSPRLRFTSAQQAKNFEPEMAVGGTSIHLRA
ncbi:MAG TPA: hypothetical protein VIM69_13005, partial [Opitutaceae bacterium]